MFKEIVCQALNELTPSTWGRDIYYREGNRCCLIGKATDIYLRTNSIPSHLTHPFAIYGLIEDGLRDEGFDYNFTTINDNATDLDELRADVNGILGCSAA